MKIWLINAYGNLPSEGWSEYRTTLMAKTLSEAGHDVVWWVSNFEHRSKKFRSEGWKDVRVNEKFLIKIVPSSSYHKHISFARIRYERIFCKNLYKKVCETNETPDCIIIGEPALFANDIIIRLVKRLNTFLIIDIIDLWPELFKIFLPKWLIKFEKLIFLPFYKKRSWFLRKSDAIIAVTNDYLEIGKKNSNAKYYETIYWGLNSNRLRVKYDKKQVELEFNRYKIPLKKQNDFFIIYAGTLGENYDISSILNVALSFKNKKLDHFKIIIAGDGPLKEFIVDFVKSNDLNNLFFIGRINNDSLHCIFSQCDISLCTYVKDSTVSLPIKFYDYLSAGLPILTSLEREIANLISQHKIGLLYESENFHDLENKIFYLSWNREILNSMRENVFNIADIYSYENQYQKLIKLIDKIN